MKILTATTAQTPEALINDLRALVSDAELMLNDPPGGNQGEALAALCDRFAAGKQRLADTYRTARNRITTGARQADQVIRANPYQSLALALGAGLLIGLRLTRRGR